jgi:hypothetical protein
MKIRLLAAEFFHADERTDRQTLLKFLHPMRLAEWYLLKQRHNFTFAQLNLVRTET